ncbi:unnamed protein product [Vicia faba]|uniref:Protein kinase domain-containing protein n=1 Tax=Vicia faba TaxID=3906 RepID=A0AAV1BCY1_VICFA|nr:unnamed protein product [Vicia faba]
MCAEPIWKGFAPQTNELIMLGDGNILNDGLRSQLEDIYMDDHHQHNMVRVNSDAVDVGREVRESLETNRLEYLIPKKTSLRHRLPMVEEGFIEFVGDLLQINPNKRPSASEALKHPWLCYPYEPISS